MKESINERRLRYWKARQIARGYDVSKVNTLEEANHFFDKAFGNKKVIEGAEETVTIKALSDMTIKELTEQAHKLGLEVKSKAKKDELIRAIEEANYNISTEKESEEEITELEVQAVVNAIVEQAAEDNKTIEEVVTEIVEESTEPVIEGE